MVIFSVDDQTSLENSQVFQMFVKLLGLPQLRNRSCADFPFWELGITYYSIPIYVFLQNHISTYMTQSQHFVVFFLFQQCLDEQG